MIDLPSAKALVLSHLARMERELNELGQAHPGGGERLHLTISEIVEHEFGWIFGYCTQEYLDTHDSRFALAGNAPLMVHKQDGLLRVAGTDRPTSHQPEAQK